MSEEKLSVEAQEAADELWSEQIIPFKLTAHTVEAGSQPGYFTVQFLDNRVPSLFIYWNLDKESFKTAVREVAKRTVGKRVRRKNEVSETPRISEGKSIDAQRDIGHRGRLRAPSGARARSNGHIPI